MKEELAEPDHGFDEFIGAEKVTAYRAKGELYRAQALSPFRALEHMEPSYTMHQPRIAQSISTRVKSFF